MMELSRRLAIVFGLVVPIAETVRRWHQLGETSIWPFWLDDWAIGGLLLCMEDKEGRRGWPAVSCGRLGLYLRDGVCQFLLASRRP